VSDLSRKDRGEDDAWIWYCERSPWFWLMLECFTPGFTDSGFTMFHGFRSKKHVQLGSQYVWVVWGAKWRYSPDDIVGLSSGMVNSDFDWSHENESPAATYHDKTSWSRNAENSWSHICWINFPSRRIIHSLHLVDPTKKRCNEPQSKKWQTFANKN
jgi:hypothetical protein